MKTDENALFERMNEATTPAPVKGRIARALGLAGTERASDKALADLRYELEGGPEFSRDLETLAEEQIRAGVPGAPAPVTFEKDQGVAFTSRGVEKGGLVRGTHPRTGRIEVLVTSHEGDEVEPYTVEVSPHRLERIAGEWPLEVGSRVEVVKVEGCNLREGFRGRIFEIVGSDAWVSNKHAAAFVPLANLKRRKD